MKQISKSKRQLTQLLIEAGVKQFPEGANWAAQDKRNPHKDDDIGITLYVDKPEKPPKSCDYWGRSTTRTDIVKWVKTETLITNWHQTVLSRAEFDQIVAESVEQDKSDADGWIEWKGGECPVDGDLDVSIRTRCWRSGAVGKASELSWEHRGDGGDIVAYRLHKPEQVEPQYCESVTPENFAEKIDVERVRNYLATQESEQAATPTLDQLLQDYRNASDFAATKQTEADEAAKMRDERWRAVQARACELGVHISVELVVDAEMRESELVITDWRDLRKGDVIWWSGDRNFLAGEYAVYDTEGCGYEGPYTILLELGDCREWIDNDDEEWHFIRRP